MCFMRQTVLCVSFEMKKLNAGWGSDLIVMAVLQLNLEGLLKMKGDRWYKTCFYNSYSLLNTY